jgi:outer membrane receptor protein involved in Fe transport
MRTLLLSAGLAALTVAAAPSAMAQTATAAAQQAATELAPVSVLATRTEVRPDEVPGHGQRLSPPWISSACWSPTSRIW